MLQIAGYIGSVVVVCFDALMVTRNVKLAFDFIWTLNGLRALFGMLFTVAEASFMKPILFRIGWETFSIQTIRTEVCLLRFRYSLSHMRSTKLFFNITHALMQPIILLAR
jgi:hypothetical protein